MSTEIDVTKRYKPTSAMILMVALAKAREGDSTLYEQWLRTFVQEEVHKALHPEQENAPKHRENTFADVSNEQIVSAGMPIHQPYEYCCPLHYPMSARKKS